MKVVEIRREEDLQPLRAAWDQLVCESGSGSIFLTWEWATAWWAAYGKPGDLLVLTFLDDGGNLRGIAPLRRQKATRFGQSVPVLSFVGDSSIEALDLNDSDYLDFIVSPGYEREVLEAFNSHWTGVIGSNTILLLNEIPETSPNLPLLKDMAEGQGMIWAERNVGCSIVHLPETWDAYLASLQSRFRTKVRSVFRNLENRSEVKFRFCERPEELDRVLRILFDLHTRRWAEEGKAGVFHWDRKRDFYFRLSRLLLERKWLRLSWLEWNGQILACQFGFVYGGSYFQLQEGYEPAAEHWNLGMGLRAWSIREFLKEGIREYDFMGGVGRHKSSWGAVVKQSKRIEMARRGNRALLFCRGPEWKAATRESIRKMVPEKILAAREKLQGTAGKGPGSTWAREATANAYFHLGLPAVSRQVREHYQLCMEPASGMPKASFRRRSGPAARILYYHRVNNEQDPFFEAISTGLFDQQMQYLARNYRVVSLSDAVRNLEEGESPELMVAVTFDDGYRDNYENAFPILQRYGIPATIFLTTGNIDSGEPMWFEQLAEAFQQTPLEYVDTELEIPRRFWTRTMEERRRSNDQAFAVLRQTTDDQRRRWLESLLQSLQAPAVSSRRNKMLTWEQAREMNAAEINFGGHTVSHPFLSKLTSKQEMWEVGECKRRIESELQCSVDYFAYPNGREEDIAASNKEALRAAGYKAAVSTIWGMNDRSTDRMELRRGGPWESNIAQFAYKLDWYQLVNG